MNQMIKWSPFAQLDTLHRGLSKILNSEDVRSGLPDWAPVVDILEDDKAYHLRVDLPGVRKDEVDVELEGTVLTVRGERKAEREEKSRKYHRVERFFGSFARSFDLPEDIDGGQIEATFRDGVLNVSVGKAPHAQPKRIEIKVN